MAGISKTVFYSWLQSGEVSGVLPVIKKSRLHTKDPDIPPEYLPGGGNQPFCHWLQVGETAKSGRFLEFLDTQKGLGRIGLDF